MENNLRRVALLNTKGIHAMVMGRKNHVPRALHAFKKALEDLEGVRACASLSSSDQHDEQEYFLEAFNSSPIACRSFHQPLDQVEEEEHQHDNCVVSAEDAGAFFVYNRAVGFKPLSDTSNVGLTFYKSILQFNMALAHHVKAASATTTTTKSNKSHMKALKYYKLCLRTLKEIGIAGGAMADRPPYPGGGEAMIFLRLAALNNMAHVYQLQADYRRVEDTLARVFKFTVAQRPTLFASCDSSSSQEEEEEEDEQQQQQDDEQQMDMMECSSNNLSTTTTTTNTSSSMDEAQGRRTTRQQGASQQHNTTTNNNSLMNSAVVNEVLLNVMVSTGGPLVIGAGAA